MTLLAYHADPSPPCWTALGNGSQVLFSTRKGGVSAPPFDSLNVGRSTVDEPAAVTENRRRILARFGSGPDHVATAGQIHGAAVTRATAPGLHPNCDALITTIPRLPIAITIADCVPVLLAADGWVGAAHAGWRGLSAGIVPATIQAMKDAGSPPATRFHAWIGPCIRVCCYEVGPEVADRFPTAVRSTERARPRLDLVAVAREQLSAAGIPADHIADVGECTRCVTGRYFSHRANGPRTGRQWAVAMLGS